MPPAPHGFLSEPGPDEPADKTGSWLVTVFHSHLGFDLYDAMKLAHAKADWHKVEEVLKTGCDRDLVLRIFT